MNEHRLRVAVESKARLNFYIVALVFTALGFAIQTAPTYTHYIFRIVELLAWVCLFTGGVAGIFYLDQLAEYDIGRSSRDLVDKELSDLKAKMQSGVETVPGFTGESVPIEDQIGKFQIGVNVWDSLVQMHHEKRERLKVLLFVGFILGFFLLGVARGMPHVCKIVYAFGA
jgi:hypothetical protein